MLLSRVIGMWNLTIVQPCTRSPVPVVQVAPNNHGNNNLAPSCNHGNSNLATPTNIATPNNLASTTSIHDNR